MKKRLVYGLMLFLLPVACSKDGPVQRSADLSRPHGREEEQFVPADYILLNVNAIELRKTDKRQLSVLFWPMDATKTPVTWESGNPAVAFVDETGLVTAAGAGVTTVTASSGSHSVSCEVSVWEHGCLQIEYVDLGLSVDWCTTDLGAGSPDGRGTYYAWGEIVPKTFFDWSNYVHCGGAYNQLRKYNGDSALGVCDSRRQLDLYDDVAYRLMDESYRIPTSAQWVELLENCLWEEDGIGEVKGYRVSSKTDPDRWIFLPYGDGVNGVLPSVPSTRRGQYWSASRVEKNSMSEFAWTVMFYADHVIQVENERSYGMRIRPVRMK